MSKWYGEIEKRFDGDVSYRTWEQDGHVYENVTILLPNNEIQAVRVDGDNQNILVGVDGWTKECSSEELSSTILNRMDLYG